jgi:glycosyltransferase involved in cell wall biosynthesis
MKIAVYTIALNEEKFVERWYESAKDADYLLIADTGSNDKTVKIAKKLGINVIDISIKPWRFDDARNAALAALPDDIDMCISLDLDEVLSDGWREAIEKTTATQIMYRYTYSWNNQDQTLPGSVTAQAKVHARHGYRWKYIVHEYILPDRNENHCVEESEDFTIVHYPDNEKSRSSYDKLIKDQLEEDPTSDRYQIYYAKSLLQQEKIEEAAKEFKKFIAMEKLTTEATHVASSYITLSFLEPKKKKKYLKAAVKSWYAREPLISLAIYHFNNRNWRQARKYCKKTLEITQRTTDPNYLEYAWGYLPKNMLYVCNHNLKFKNWNSKMSLNVGSLTSSNFDLFKDSDVL